MLKLTWQSVLGGLFALALAATTAALVFSSGDKAGLVTATAIFTGALILVAALPRLSEFTIGPRGVVGKISQLQVEVNTANEHIAELFVLSMSDDAFGNLTKLDGGWNDHYYLDPELKVGLAVELNYLKTLGYISFDKEPSVKGVEDLPKGNQTKLSRFISVTAAGKRFIDLRQRAKKGVLAQ
jgi:hypothetical protein